ncbi:ATP synthase subunit I [Halomonas sp. 1390]|uniref:ATP synthase subunit I n=1 Tax=Halomonas sp. B23F22_3 TaxID=3459516 RepID=UPI00373FC262
MAARNRRPSLRPLWVAQLAAMALMVGLAAGFKGPADAVSALVGSAVALLPNIYFAWRVFRHRGGRQARRAVHGLYRAAAGKFGLTVALFTLVFVTVPLSNHALFFGAYVVTLFAYWLASWQMTRQTPN